MWNDEEIMKQIKSNTEEHKPMDEQEYKDETTPVTDRNLLLIGCGDGGCNAMSTVYNQLTSTRAYAIAYNTSVRGMKNINSSVHIIPKEEDGSGKLREYSKEVFKKGSYKYILSEIDKATQEKKYSYIVIFTTTDGGTGSGMSPIVAKLIMDNVDIPVIMVGIYSTIREDAIAQYNSLEWQRDIEKINVPYMIFDNNSVNGTKREIHNTINQDIANAMKLIAGVNYGNSNISMIDNRDMLMLLANTGRRIVIAQNVLRPTVGQDFDEYVNSMIQNNHQPLPISVRGIGIFLKGSTEMLKKLDTSLLKIRDLYGDATIQYTHLEESENIMISILMTGCSSPNDRLIQMRDRYDEIMLKQNENESEVNTMLSGINNPLGSYDKKKKREDTDLSGLDI